VKNVTISLNDALLERSRDYARSHGKSFNQLVRDVLADLVDDEFDRRLKEVFDDADELGWKLEGPLPSREERNAR
jgi:hypothetical protein